MGHIICIGRRYEDDWFLIALLSGALMSVQGVFNTQVTKTTGMWVSNGWVQFSAFLLCAVAWLIAGRDSVGALWKVEPRYVLLGGVIGAGITWTVIKSMASLGPAKAALLIVISQLIVAYVIELLGLFGVDKEPLEIRKIIGMSIALIGVAIFNGNSTINSLGICGDLQFPTDCKGEVMRRKKRQNKITEKRNIQKRNMPDTTAFSGIVKCHVYR